MCLVPDGDLFEAIARRQAPRSSPTASRRSPRTGIRLSSGDELEADVIVTATGLNVLHLRRPEISVDGARLELPGRVAYKGMMLGGVPNFASRSATPTRPGRSRSISSPSTSAGC